MKWHYKKKVKKIMNPNPQLWKNNKLKNNINKPSQPELIFKICDSGHEINTNHMEKKSKKNHKSKSPFNKYWWMKLKKKINQKGIKNKTNNNQ
jgi:hypothetical protein